MVPVDSLLNLHKGEAQNRQHDEGCCQTLRKTE